MARSLGSIAVPIAVAMLCTSSTALARPPVRLASTPALKASTASPASKGIATRSRSTGKTLLRKGTTGRGAPQEAPPAPADPRSTCEATDGDTGTVALDRSVYPVPFGVPGDFGFTPSSTPVGRSVFPIHQSGIDQGNLASDGGAGLDPGEHLSGDVVVHIRVSDADFDQSAGEDLLAQPVAGTTATGPVRISVIRGAEKVVLGYAGGPSPNAGLIDVNGDAELAPGGTDAVRQLGPMTELAAGVFGISFPLRFSDGPASEQCPDVGYVESQRFDSTVPNESFCVLQGDILQVEYTDPRDQDGCTNVSTDSATFDLRNGVLQADRTHPILGSEFVLTLIDPDLDLDAHEPDSFTLDLVEWSSAAATRTLGDAGGGPADFEPIPATFHELGNSSGIFQTSLLMPHQIGGAFVAPGSAITLEYTDWGPAGSDFVGDEDEDVTLVIHAANEAAAVHLDRKVYTWTDKVLIEVIAPTHDIDPAQVDEIEVTVSTRSHALEGYVLSESGADTGVFVGDVVLTGFPHDADGDPSTGVSGAGQDTSPETSGVGPSDGLLESDDDDGFSVSFEVSPGVFVVGSALVRWNIGEVQWLEASYAANAAAGVRVVDRDMNLDPEALDAFVVDVWSDSDAGGIDLLVVETGVDTGIFRSSVRLTVTGASSGNQLRVSEGDTITVEYEDHTLPDPYTTRDSLDIRATALIGTGLPGPPRMELTRARALYRFATPRSR